MATLPFLKNNKLNKFNFQQKKLLKLNISLEVLPTLYQALVNSHSYFNPLASPLALTKYIDNDIKSFPVLRKHFKLYKHDCGHILFLSASLSVYALKSLTGTLLEAYTREILVYTNTPPIHAPNPTQTLSRSRLHAPIINPSSQHNSIADVNAICADAGFLLLHTLTPTINAAIMLLTQIYTHTYIPIGSSNSSHHTNAHLHPFNHLLHPSNRSYMYMYGSLHHRLFLIQFSTKYEHGNDADTPFPLSLELLPYFPHSLPPLSTLPTNYNASLYDELIEEASQFITCEYSRLLHFATFTPPVDEHPDPALYMRAKPLPNPASWRTTHPSNLPPLIASHLGALETSSPLHYFRQFIMSFHLDCSLNSETSHLPSLFADTLQSPLIFSSDGSHHAANMRTAAASVLVALTTTTPISWSTSPVIPFHFKLHLLPFQIGTAPPDINQAEAHGAFLSLITAPTTLPSIIVLDSRVIFDFIFHFYFPTIHSLRSYIRHRLSSITYYYSGLLTHVLQHHQQSFLSSTPTPLSTKLSALQQTVVSHLATNYHTTPADIHTFNPTLYNDEQQRPYLSRCP